MVLTALLQFCKHCITDYRKQDWTDFLGKKKTLVGGCKIFKNENILDE